MLNFAVTNVANKGREIYIFHRIGEKLSLFKDLTFKPYFYQPSNAGIYKTIDRKKVKKVICNQPYEVGRKRNKNSYEADVLFYKRYIIDKIGKFLPAKIKYSFIDIEVLCSALPSPEFPDSPISCISVSNNYTGKIKTFYLGDYLISPDTDLLNREKQLLNDFVEWMRKEQFDFIAAWNMLKFDWPYLSARYKKVFGVELAGVLSPIFHNRIIGSKDNPTILPAGLGVVDFLDWYKKIYKGKRSYALDSIAQIELQEESFEKVPFNVLSDKLKEKNINDIRRMMKIEEKLHIVNYYDELRRMSKSAWEDLSWNSKILDMMVLSEAKSMGIILPSKNYDSELDETFEGAYRRCNIEDKDGTTIERLTGLYKNLYKVDLSSAYPQSIINFCLDIGNIRENEGIEIQKTRFVQKSNALLPMLARKLINKKEEIKKRLNALDPETQEAKDLQIKYDATKAVVNSLFGVCGLKVFRLFDIRIARAITFLIRDLLHYVENKLQERGIKIIYIDTDGLLIRAEENPTDLCNQLIKQWAKEKYNKNNVEIEFDYEGIFEKIFIIALCHYDGDLLKKNGKRKHEEKGIEVKRADSSKYIKHFQAEVINKIKNEETKEQIESFVKQEKERIKILPLNEVGFPCKLKNTVYKSPPIFVRGNKYTKELNPKWQKFAGDSFYYIPVEPFGTATRKSKRTSKKTGETTESITEVKKDVLCFDDTKESQDLVKKMKVNWKKVIDKSIDSKMKKIYDAMGWTIEKSKHILSNQTCHKRSKHAKNCSIKKEESMKADVLDKEIALISNNAIREFVKKSLENTPDYFYIGMASSTGKHHPACTCKKGGLIVHVKRAIYFISRLCLGLDIKGIDKDIVLAAGILHDIAKVDKNKSTYEDYENHPINACNYFAVDVVGLDDKILQKINNCICFHMGLWTPKCIKKPIEKYSKLEFVVYMADYLAATKDLVTPKDQG